MPDFGDGEAPGGFEGLPESEADPDVARYMRWREKNRPKLTHTYRRGAGFCPEEKSPENNTAA